MIQFLFVALGGAVGAMARYGLSRALPVNVAGGDWPWPTFAANLLGSFLMGALAAWLLVKPESGESWRLLIGVGLLGGFTTFSAFSLEMLTLWDRRGAMMALTYGVSSLCLGLCLVYLGVLMMRRFLT